MPAFEISVRADVKKLEKSLNDFAYKQLPFATAQALTNLGKQVQLAEKTALPSIFDKPTPFTQNAIGVIPARKDNPQALVFMKDITAAYLAPYEFGGKNKLNSKALLKPVAQGVNQYGNLPRNKLQQLIGKGDVFVGSITFKKSGQTVHGVWQRPKAGKRYHGSTKYGSMGDTRNKIGGIHTGLTLLIKFTDAHEVKQHIDWFNRAATMVRKNFNAEFGKALAKALATAK